MFQAICSKAWWGVHVPCTLISDNSTICTAACDWTLIAQSYILEPSEDPDFGTTSSIALDYIWTCSKLEYWNERRECHCDMKRFKSSPKAIADDGDIVLVP